MTKHGTHYICKKGIFACSPKKSVVNSFFILMLIEKKVTLHQSSKLDVGVNNSDKSQEKTFAKFLNRAFSTIEL